ncbi:hypothetical protein [Flagellimonas myxillae]|uniref:hypothetical protein n=1 Tax=Flagellimonas myxillae TaxID=2942214 RepID=UPI00201EBE26|nr:hypothetical protein [Muricauda myxillae]MCL6264938.1 hypothetical protein [Muricauda myxillae]
MKKLLLWRFSMPIVICMALACTEEQNFGQFDDLSVTPTVASSIFYLESTEEVINLTPTAIFYAHTFNFDPFSEQYVADHLLEGVLLFEIENTTSKQLSLSIEFLDENDDVLDVEVFTVDPEPTMLVTRSVAYGPGGKSLDILRNTSGLRVTAENLGDTVSVSTAEDPKIILGSAAEFRFRLQ